MRRLLAPLAAALTLLAFAGPAAACGGLIGPNGAVNLLRTSTLAAYHDGIEHYITAFAFAGGGGEFGSIVPLPGIPTEVERGGAWTLQRLAIETQPPVLFAAGDAFAPVADRAQVLLTARIDALDITILRGGGAEIGAWATEHGFRLPPDAPEVLDFYANRSPIFMTAVFDADAAAERGQAVGDGTPVHLTIPTDNPWVPLRILALGKDAAETVQADVYLLTDGRPAMLPSPTFGFGNGLQLTHSADASDQLLSDLRSDDGMGWVPQRAYLSKIEINAPAGDLRFDLAIDASGLGMPSPIDAGFQPLAVAAVTLKDSTTWLLLIGLPLLAVLLVAAGRRSGDWAPRSPLGA